MKGKKTAATLLEMTLTIGLFAIVLSVLGSLLTDTAKITRRADDLSWSNKASHWLDRMEFDVASASSLAVAAGGSDTSLTLSVRDIDSPIFLQDPSPDPWNPDASQYIESRTYEIQSENLVLITTSPSLGTQSYILGPADALEIDRSSEGEVSMTIRRNSDQVRREVPALTLDSERAPL